MDLVSINTLKSLTNPHTIRSIATRKDVEPFWKWNFEKYRESIVKLLERLIVNLNLPNKLPIYSKANCILAYTNCKSTKDSTT